MLVQCPCGKKLKVNDSQVGKKVRCPKCEEVFVVEDEEEEGIQAEPKQPKGGSDSFQEEPPRKKKVNREEEPNDEEDADEDEEGETRSSKKKGKRGSPPKKGVSLVRNIVSAAVLVVLLGVAGFIYWRQMAKPGTVKLEIWEGGLDVSINGKKVPYDFKPGWDSVTVSVDLGPGNHQIKVTKDDRQPITMDVAVKSGEEQSIQIRPKRIAPPPRKGPP